MLYTTEPANVLSVRAVQVQPSDIQGGYIHQTISWRRPDNHVHITHYLIRYGAGVISRDTEGGGLPTVNSTTNSTVLMLSKPTSHTTYSVWVAAVSQAGEGKFSDRVDFNYSSKPTQQISYASYSQPKTCNDFSCPHSSRPPHWSEFSQVYMQQHQLHMVCPTLHWRSTSGGVCSEGEREGLTTDD